MSVEELHTAQAIRRKVYRDAAERTRQSALMAAQDAIRKAAEHPCDFCRDLPRGPHGLKHNCGWLLGLVVDLEADTATCPQCHTILAEWEP